MGPGVRFNNAADILQSGSPVPQDKFTITGWVNSIVTPAYGVFVSLEGTAFQYDDFFVSADHVDFRPPFPGLISQLHAGPYETSKGTWYFFAISHDANQNSGNDDFTLFGIPGSLDLSTVIVGKLGAFTATKMTIAASQLGNLEGHMANVKVWNRKLTQAECEAEADSVAPVVTTDLWADYRLDFADLLADSSGNGRTLTNPGAAGSWTETSSPPAEGAPVYDAPTVTLTAPPEGETGPLAQFTVDITSPSGVSLSVVTAVLGGPGLEEVIYRSSSGFTDRYEGTIEPLAEGYRLLFRRKGGMPAGTLEIRTDAVSGGSVA